MISVVLAAYKGEKYIEAQVRSILPQLGENDELIISDDFPQGKTRQALEPLMDSDSRIVYLQGPGKGVIKNFEYGIAKAKGDCIFLADQDDVWLENKVETVVREIENGADLVLHNALITDGELNETGETSFEVNRTTPGILRNIVKNSYQGCCMAFHRDLVRYILPFPERLPMHDQWIGLMAEKHGKVKPVKEPLILYRRHAENVSGNGSSLADKIKWRFSIISSLIGR